jgi:predicted transcriptional regulator
VSAIVFALVAVGAVAPRVYVPDHTNELRTFPDQKQALLVIYEDQDGGKQNKVVKELLGKINSDPKNRAKVDVVAVADLEKWSWWPARKYALADVQKAANEKKTTIYLDWKGELRRVWGLSKGKNNLVLVGTDGVVRFSSEGPIGEEQQKQLLAEMVKLGVTL